jgi:alpha-mannosidase
MRNGIDKGMTGPEKVYVVSHTHWDREWYFTKSTFQMMNADMMEQLLDILHANEDFTAFVLDGQLVALEDYLAVCPNRKGEIESLVKAGRLAIGPWYVLPDEYLASGEAHIRNFMTGMRIAEEFGGGMKLGYLPDSFGHPSQMPQIIKGLNMGEMIFWRGPGPEVKHAEFIWQGKDGSAILALNMVYGYSNAACLPEDMEKRHQRLDHEIKKLSELSNLGIVLLMNGSDHIAPDGRVAGWIREYHQVHPEIEIRHTTLTEYVLEARERASRQALQTVTGELRSGYRAYLLGDTLSTRMPIKQRQRSLEVMTENRLEPLYAMLSMEGKAEYPTEKMFYLWKCLLQNLPHDSICGCSMDAVHREMESRSRQTEEIGTYLLAKAAKCTGGGNSLLDDSFDGEVTVYNPQLGSQRSAVSLKLQKVLHPLRYVDYHQDQKLLEFTGDSHVPRPTGILFADGQGKEYPGWITDVEIVDTVESNPYTQPTMNRCMQVTAGFVAEAPSLGYKEYGYRFTYGDKQGEAQTLENEFYKVTGEADGTVSVLCKADGKWYHGLNRFCDKADVGDEYTADFLPDEQGIAMNPSGITRIVCSHTLTVEGILELPAAASHDRKGRSDETVSCRVKTSVTLLPGVERIEIHTDIDNQAKDHCLSVLFPFGEKAEGCLSDSIFSIEDRRLMGNGESAGFEGWMEKPNNSFFQKNFAELHREGHSLSVQVMGLPQFEVKREEKQDILALTLLRCVGWLSRDDLNSRNGNGGWSLETPDAQEIGLRSFDYAVSLRGGASPQELYRAAIEYTQGLFALQVSRQGALLNLKERSFVSVDQPGLFVSAFKGAEDGNGWILRLVHMADTIVSAKLSLHGQQLHAEAVRLDESPLDEDAVLWDAKRCEAVLSFGPWQLRTLRITK